MADASVVSDTTVLLVALLTTLGVTAAPIAVALINRGGKARRPDQADLHVVPTVSRAEFDALLEQLVRLDDECDRLSRENQRLREELRR